MPTHDPQPRTTGGEEVIDLRLGRYQDVLADVSEVSAVICDPPYSARTHEGYDDGARFADEYGFAQRSNGGIDRYRPRRVLDYGQWGAVEVNQFVAFWGPRCAGWFVCLSDNILCPIWRHAFEENGLTGFQPVPILIPGMTVRFAGDGPSSWAVYANVARPKALHKWGTLPGGYYVKQEKTVAVGGKPLWLMNAIIRDYSRPGDLICDPCAGGGTTLIAAASQGRKAIGAEMDPVTHAKAMRRIEAGYTPDWIEIVA